MTVAASGSNLTYQWYQDGVKIPGATKASYDVEDEGTYYVVVSDGTTSPCCGIFAHRRYRYDHSYLQDFICGRNR